MDYTMIVSDAVVAAALTCLCVMLFKFLRAAQANVGKHESGSDEASHFVAHIAAGGLGFIGCVLGSVASILHLILQNTGGHIVPEHVELVGNVGYTLMFIASALFVHHMTQEENPEHPFFYSHMHKGSHHV